MERSQAYGTARTAVVWQVLRAELARRDGAPLSVVDVGGGTGGFAVPLAQSGHRVTVVDASPDALAALTRRAADAGVADRVDAQQGDASDLPSLVPPGSVDVVLCHSLLEVVDAPEWVASALAGALRPGGAASVLVANRAAAVLSRAVGGHLGAATALLADPDGIAGPRDTLQRRYDTGSATDLLAAAGLVVESVHGVRVVADLVPGALLDAEPGSTEALAAFELAAAGLPPYRDIATQLHLLARRPV
ncbi:methyltransferase domain-containing protein [Actinocatenispora rupis]|uniref:Methyltransferase n=1 Tax=Actinocatenispora rupis TaxID=519421 RepID=A0A8J3J0I7_9ACTN|nr:methyltransferase domain-containing protein [Actinocatenispora rupis]GID09271.1 methyltransferase [Actinocatenispora rupis]